MEEVELRIKGKVDNWRIQRACAFLIHRSCPVESVVNILEEIPLPFDDEYNHEAEQIEDNAAIWHEAQEQFKREDIWAKYSKKKSN